MIKRAVCCFVSLLIALFLAGTTSFAWECIGPEDNNCLQCHELTSGIHSPHWNIGIGAYPDCSVCHCGEEGSSPCGTTNYGPVETYCCTSCHSECLWVNEHTSNGFDCAACHASTIGFDDDCDGICNSGESDPSCTGSDNCPETPNGPNLGTCTSGNTGYLCFSDDDCGIDGFCSLNQEDTNGDGTGDVCQDVTTTSSSTTTTTITGVLLTIGNGSGFPGSEENPIEISLDNQNDKVKTLLVEVCDEDNYLEVFSDFGCETISRASDLSCLAYELNNGCVRVTLGSETGELIEEGTGPIVVLQYTVSSSAPSGVCRNLSPGDIFLMSDEHGQHLDVTKESGEFCFEPMTTTTTTTVESTTTTTVESTTTTTTSPYMHNGFCKVCHDENDLHAIPGHSDCSKCHTGIPELGNVDPGKCNFCHPTCNNIKYHDLDIGTDCLSCHTECLISTSTTTSIKKPVYTVSIFPTSAILDPSATVQFSANTTEDGEEVEGTYIWEIVPESTIGSVIDEDGLFTAGENNTSSEVEETIKVTDTAHKETSATAVVTIKVYKPPLPDCEVKISPETATVSPGDTIVFSAETTGEECLEGSYQWEVESSIGSYISADGVYTAGDNDSNNPVTDVITANDTANNLSADTTVTVLSGIVAQVSPDPLWKSHWVPLPNLIIIKGEKTHFYPFETNIDYQPKGLVLPFCKLILGEETIWSLIMVMPSWLAGKGDRTVTVTVTTGDEVVSDDFTIKELPFILDQAANVK